MFVTSAVHADICHSCTKNRSFKTKEETHSSFRMDFFGNTALSAPRLARELKGRACVLLPSLLDQNQEWRTSPLEGYKVEAEILFKWHCFIPGPPGSLILSVFVTCVDFIFRYRL